MPKRDLHTFNEKNPVAEVGQEDEPTWEQIADQLANAFLFMRKQNGAASFPSIDGMVWYEAVKVYEKKKHPLLRLTPGAINDRYPGRG